MSDYIGILVSRLPDTFANELIELIIYRHLVENLGDQRRSFFSVRFKVDASVNEGLGQVPSVRFQRLSSPDCYQPGHLTEGTVNAKTYKERSTVLHMSLCDQKQLRVFLSQIDCKNMYNLAMC